MKTFAEWKEKLNHGKEPLPKWKFNRYATKTKKRIVALDAWKLAKVDVLRASSTYSDVDLDPDFYQALEDTLGEDAVLDVPICGTNLEEAMGSCYVCGIGSLFFGHIVAQNDYTFGDLHNCTSQDDIYVRLGGVFDERELELIETFYEGTTDTSGCRMGEEDAARVVEFHLRNLTPKKRLLAILRHIVVEGTIVPEKLVPKVRKFAADNADVPLRESHAWDSVNWIEELLDEHLCGTDKVYER